MSDAPGNRPHDNQTCAFCKIIRGEEIASIVFENSLSLAFLDHRVSQSVPHVHIHLVPRHRNDGLKGFFWPRQRYQDEAHLQQVRDILRGAIASLQSGL